MAKFPTLEEFAKQVAEKALDELKYNGRTIREWADLIVFGDVTDRKEGEWIEDEYGYTHCSECGMEWDEPEHPPTKFCPECGALMTKHKEAPTNADR